MKYRLCNLFCLGLILVLSGCSSTGAAKKMIGHTPQFAQFTLLDGDRISTAAFRGKQSAFMFWATWCHRSTPAIEEFNELAKKYSNRPDIVFMAASLDKPEDLEKVKERIQYRNLSSLQHAFSGNVEYDEAYMIYRGEVLPYFLVLNQQGTVVAAGDSVEDIEPGLK